MFWFYFNIVYKFNILSIFSENILKSVYYNKQIVVYLCK